MSSIATDFVHYTSKASAAAFLDDACAACADSTWSCGGCGLPKPGTQSVDVQLKEIPDGPLNAVFGYGVAIARRPFLQRYGWARISQNCGIGTVRGPDGDLLADWVTFIGRRTLVVRGNQHTTYRICPECGRGLYFSMGQRYLCPPPSQGIELFESDLWGLIVPAPIAATLEITESDGVWIETLPVLDEPLDGLPVNLP